MIGWHLTDVCALVSHNRCYLLRILRDLKRDMGWVKITRAMWLFLKALVSMRLFGIDLSVKLDYQDVTNTTPVISEDLEGICKDFTKGNYDLGLEKVCAVCACAVRVLSMRVSVYVRGACVF